MDHQRTRRYRAVLVVNERGDEKPFGDAVGPAHQCSGALGKVSLYQVAVHLTYASRRRHAMTDRELYLPAAWAADEERRLLTHVPHERKFATKPQLRPPPAAEGPPAPTEAIAVHPLPIRSRREQRPRTPTVSDQYNEVIRGIHSVWERANSLLKTTFKALRRVSLDPSRITKIAVAALVLLQLGYVRAV